MKATVTVELKPGVLDPQGKAIQHSLGALGFSGVEDVRAGKVFRIALNDQLPKEDAEREIRKMCEKLLANPVVENYSFSFDD